MSRLDDDLTILREDFPDDNCTNEPTGADWFRSRVIYIPEFLEHRDSPTNRTETVFRKATSRATSLESANKGLLAKDRELFVSTILFFVIFLVSVGVILFGGSSLFWAPIALGSFGVCGSSALYRRQLRLADSEEIEPIRSYG